MSILYLACIKTDNKSNKHIHILITILLFSLKEEEQTERIFPGNQKLGTKRKVGRKLSIALHPNLLILNPPVLLEDGMEPKTLGSVT